MMHSSWVLLLLPVGSAFTVPSAFTTRTTTNPNFGNHGNARSLLYAASTATDYDLIVVGAGIVGVQTALLAAQAPYRKRVLLVDAPSASGQLQGLAGEDLSIGGPTGLFSKALRDASKRIQVNSLRGMGLREDSVWNEIINSCVNLASSNALDIRRQLEFAGVDFMEGFCSFPDAAEADINSAKKSLIVTQEKNADSKETIRANKILIATGSQPFRPDGIPFDGKRIFDSDSINSISYLPKSVVITGSGIIAIEFAKIFRNLGADVTMIIRDQVPRNALMKIGLDKDIAATLVADLIQSGIRIERGAQVASFSVPDAPRAPIKLTLVAKDGGARHSGATTELRCDMYLAAVGRKPNTNSLNLKAAGINVDEYGGILVDNRLMSRGDSNVFAAGDVLGRPFLASTGVAQAKAAVHSMFGTTTTLVDATDNTSSTATSEAGYTASGIYYDPASLASNPFAFPTAVWSSPEAAYYGLSTQQALATKTIDNVGEGIALYAECLRGRVFSPTGLLKLVYDKQSMIILGVHICGDDACELIHYGMELVKGQRTINELTNAMFSAVTYHELYRIAAQAALDEVGARKRRAAAGKALAARRRQQTRNDTE
jgi:NAD(P) transhydrogenase